MGAKLKPSNSLDRGHVFTKRAFSLPHARIAEAIPRLVTDIRVDQLRRNTPSRTSPAFSITRAEPMFSTSQTEPMRKIAGCANRPSHDLGQCFGHQSLGPTRPAPEQTRTPGDGVRAAADRTRLGSRCRFHPCITYVRARCFGVCRQQRIYDLMSRRVRSAARSGIRGLGIAG